MCTSPPIAYAISHEPTGRYFSDWMTKSGKFYPDFTYQPHRMFLYSNRMHAESDIKLLLKSDLRDPESPNPYLIVEVH